MPYETVAGTFEKASRLGHSGAAMRALADTHEFYVPADKFDDVDWIPPLIVPRSSLPLATSALNAAIAVDGSHVTQPIRDGMPSVVYGFAQAAAAYVDLSIMSSQRAEPFVDPVAIGKAVNTALVTADLPTAGAFAREGVTITESWRELIYNIFTAKLVEVNGFSESLLSLLFFLHGTPGAAATTVPVNCPNCGTKDVAVPKTETHCPVCKEKLFPTDTLRIHESVVDEGTNETALGRLRSVIELLVLVGLSMLLWRVSRVEVLPATLFLMDGPLAMYGEPAKLRAQAERFFQDMAATTPGAGPFICGIEKSGALVDFANQLAVHDLIKPGELLICGVEVLSRVTNTDDVTRYGKETYWGRKFIYRCLDSRVVVITVPPASGSAYDSRGGQPGPGGYPTLPAILDVIDRTGSTMYRNGVIPVAVAHGRAAFPIGVGTDVLRLVAERRLGLD